MDIHTLCVEGSFEIGGTVFVDDRGSFRELFRQEKEWEELKLGPIQQVRALI